MRKNWYLCVLFSYVLLIGCQNNQVFNQSHALRKDGWHKDSIASFKIPVLDSLKKYNVFFNIRNSNTYAFSNLYIIAQLNYPNGKQKVDTLQYLMAKPNGEWLGIGATSIKESKLWYLNQFQFKENGVYTITVQQAMRTNGSSKGIVNLEGITDIGIEIQKPNEYP